jgi:hypothetical protein
VKDGPSGRMHRDAVPFMASSRVSGPQAPTITCFVESSLSTKVSISGGILGRPGLVSMAQSGTVVTVYAVACSGSTALFGLVDCSISIAFSGSPGVIIGSEIRLDVSVVEGLSVSEDPDKETTVTDSACSVICIIILIRGSRRSSRSSAWNHESEAGHCQ